MTSKTQQHNFKLFSADLYFLCIEGRDKMETAQKKIKLQESEKRVGALATSRCTRFLIGWIRGLVHNDSFCVPPQQ